MSENLTEEELVKLIDDNELELSLARQQTNDYRKKFIEAETRLIFTKEIKARLEEQLKQTRLRDPKNVAPSYRDIDVERFKLVHPALLKKINKEQK